MVTSLWFERMPCITTPEFGRPPHSAIISAALFILHAASPSKTEFKMCTLQVYRHAVRKECTLPFVRTEGMWSRSEWKHSVSDVQEKGRLVVVWMTWTLLSNGIWGGTGVIAESRNRRGLLSLPHRCSPFSWCHKSILHPENWFNIHRGREGKWESMWKATEARWLFRFPLHTHAERDRRHQAQNGGFVTGGLWRIAERFLAEIFMDQ